MDEELEMTTNIIERLLSAPDSQLDGRMVERLKTLLESKPDREQMRLGLKDVLDLSVYSALASGFVMKILDIEWQRMGGKPGDPVSEEVQNLCRPA